MKIRLFITLIALCAAVGAFAEEIPSGVSMFKSGGIDVIHRQSDASEGAHYQFVARAGRVTLLQIRCTSQGWQALAAGGECIETEPWLEGYPHAVIRLDVPVARFLKSAAQAGTTQHFAMAYGDDLAEIEILCKMLKISLVIPD